MTHCVAAPVLLGLFPFHARRLFDKGAFLEVLRGFGERLAAAGGRAAGEIYVLQEYGGVITFRH